MLESSGTWLESPRWVHPLEESPSRAGKTSGNTRHCAGSTKSSRTLQDREESVPPLLWRVQVRVGELRGEREDVVPIILTMFGEHPAITGSKLGGARRTQAPQARGRSGSHGLSTRLSPLPSIMLPK
jgi:hypothetical protein